MFLVGRNIQTELFRDRIWGSCSCVFMCEKQLLSLPACVYIKRC